MSFSDWQARRPKPAPPKPRRPRQGPAQGSPVVMDGEVVGLYDRHLFRACVGGVDGEPDLETYSRVRALSGKP